MIYYVKKSPSKTDGGYVTLWLAVIQQAVNDYRRYPNMRAEVTKFFKSPYFVSMTKVNGQVILDRLKKEIKQSK